MIRTSAYLTPICETPNNAYWRRAASSRLGDYFKVDFEILDYNYMPSQQYREQFVGEPGDIVEKYLREHNNIIEELHITLVVIKDEQQI